MRKLFYIYGILSYILALGVFIYLIGFVNNFIVPKSIDSGSSPNLLTALFINLGLITLFGVQHSIMARSNFKKRWTKLVPFPIERSTYVLFTAIIISIMIFFWQPIPELVWNIQSELLSTILWIINGAGWVFTLISTRLINDKHLFGIQQVTQNLKGEKLSDPEFQIPLFYKFTRHPMMLGFLVAFWVTPQMSIGHLLFSIGFTIYIFIGIKFEERALVNYFGKEYQEYKQRVSMVIPLPNFKQSNKKNYGIFEKFVSEKNNNRF